jgi:hypothetical protein
VFQYTLSSNIITYIINNQQSARRVTAGNSKHAYISYQYLLSKTYDSPDNSIAIIKHPTNLLLLSPSLTETSSLRQESRAFLVCDLSSYNILAKTNNFILCASLLLCLIPELQKKLTWTRTQYTLCGYGHWNCNLLVKTNNFGVGDFVMCSLSKILKTPSPDFEITSQFSVFWPSQNLFRISKNKHAKFGANQYFRL